MPRIDCFTAGRRRRRVFSYLSAGMLLHAMTAVEGVITLAVLSWIDPHPLQYPTAAIGCLAALLTQLDCRSRYQEFKKARDQLVRHGPDRRIFRSLSRSRCQRDAVLAAARQLGQAAVCRNHFIDAGYRWYHLLPDFASHDPHLLIGPAFLRATFFAPTYRCRSFPPPGSPPAAGAGGDA